MRPKQPNRSQLNLLLPIATLRRNEPKQPTSDKAKIEESKRRLMADLKRSGLVQG